MSVGVVMFRITILMVVEERSEGNSSVLVCALLDWKCAPHIINSRIEFVSRLLVFTWKATVIQMMLAVVIDERSYHLAQRVAAEAIRLCMGVTNYRGKSVEG